MSRRIVHPSDFFFGISVAGRAVAGATCPVMTVHGR
jgi:nucleotide-binding universal stress UspA family protein